MLSDETGQLQTAFCEQYSGTHFLCVRCHTSLSPQAFFKTKKKTSSSIPVRLVSANDDETLRPADAFRRYSNAMEAHIEKSLSEKIDNFSLKEFTEILLARDQGEQFSPSSYHSSLVADDASGDAFDLLKGLSDFLEFKSMMLAYKNARALGFSSSAHQLLSVLHNTQQHK